MITLSPFIYAFLIPVSGVISLWCLEERSHLNMDRIVGFQDFEVNVHENISDWVIALALNSRVYILQWWRQTAASGLCFSLAASEIRTKALCVSLLLCPRSYALQRICIIPCRCALMVFV